MHGVDQDVSVPIATVSTVALTFATQSDVAWWAAASLTGRHRFATALHGLACQPGSNLCQKATRRFGTPIGQKRGFVLEGQHLGARLCTVEHFSLGYIYSVISTCIHV